jgi:hypothetical protein
LISKELLVFIICNAIIVALAVLSLVHGIRNLKWGKGLPEENKKLRLLHMIVSGLHMWCGLLILIIYLIFALIIII